jgi:hypothetical protein
MEAFSIFNSDHTIFIGGRMARRESRKILHDVFKEIYRALLYPTKLE